MNAPDSPDRTDAFLFRKIIFFTTSALYLNNSDSYRLPFVESEPHVLRHMTYNSHDILLRISALLILLSAVLYLFMPTVAPWIMAFSVALFAVRTVASPYPGKSIRGKRLFYFQIFSTLLMIMATYLMFRQRNEWALVMLCGALFMLFATVMMPRELQREINHKNDNE
ncbi:MAG: putative rane protein [Proteiniphilum sp.]|jgi:hypothetical protein|nr:putative rane protein [Proteiniphilum sp.]